MDVAQITLMGDDLSAIPEAVRLSRRTVHMIWGEPLLGIYL